MFLVGQIIVFERGFGIGEQFGTIGRIGDGTADDGGESFARHGFLLHIRPL